MNRVSDYVRAALCTALGFGYSPIAPGTVGTLPAVAIFLGIAYIAPPKDQTMIIGAALAVTCVLSIALGGWAETHWGRKDPRHFVLDEVAGFFLTVLLFRVPDPFVTAAWAFVVTRAADIVKPWPASKFEALPAGWGILMDDLGASLYAVLVLHVAYYLVPRLFLAS
ncbi:MAG: phosphatidylglycerophosphatase A [Desulfomonilaceae bacterium]|nr:phosphatidylglycerophosphatase A [Desulfomonilaceae bacterium]